MAMQQSSRHQTRHGASRKARPRQAIHFWAVRGPASRVEPPGSLAQHCCMKRLATRPVHTQTCVQRSSYNSQTPVMCKAFACCQFKSTATNAGLRRTAQMMAQELELSQGNLSLVSASTEKLSVASHEYSRQHGKLKTSKGLLRQIRWHERKEDILLYAGLGFFACCVAYVILRRTMLFVPAFPFVWAGQALRGLGSGVLVTWRSASALAKRGRSAAEVSTDPMQALEEAQQPVLGGDAQHAAETCPPGQHCEL